jgi:hypothetical protein
MEIDNATSGIDNMGMITGKNYSNAGGGAKNVNIDPDTIKASAEAISALASLRKTSANSACKKPLINIGKKKKEYEECLKKSGATQQQASTYTPPAPPSVTTPFYKTPTGVGVIILGSVFIIAGVVFAVKYKK